MLECSSGLFFSTAVTKECKNKIVGKGSQLGALATQRTKLKKCSGKVESNKLELTMEKGSNSDDPTKKAQTKQAIVEKSERSATKIHYQTPAFDIARNPVGQNRSPSISKPV